MVDYRNASISSDGASLVSVGAVQNAGLWRLPADGGRPERIPSQKEDGLAGVAWLDAETIVFTSIDGGSPQIWTMSADGANRRQITTEGSNFSPRPTRDGRTIFFVATRQGDSGIWRMDRSGARARRIADAGGRWDLALAADEQSLYFTAPNRDHLDSTWSVPAAGGPATLLVSGLTHAAASPDGREIAGVWQRSSEAEPVLAVFRIAGGEPRSVFSVRVGGDGSVWWSRDGRALYYTTTDRLNVWRQPLTGGPPTTVTDLEDGMIARGDLSFDGGSLLAVRAYPLRDAFLITGFR
jgi:Tol biopolymer transport system component